MLFRFHYVFVKPFLSHPNVELKYKCRIFPCMLAAREVSPMPLWSIVL